MCASSTITQKGFSQYLHSKELPKNFAPACH